jgi:hypothetical protein
MVLETVASETPAIFEISAMVIFAIVISTDNFEPCYGQSLKN